MDDTKFRDWTPVVLQHKKTREERERAGEIKKVFVGSALTKLENEEEPPEKKTVPLELRQRIQEARKAKGWTQKQLAQELNVLVGVVQDVESAKVVPTGPLLVKMERKLGVKLTGEQNSS